MSRIIGIMHQDRATRRSRFEISCDLSPASQLRQIFAATIVLASLATKIRVVNSSAHNEEPYSRYL